MLNNDGVGSLNGPLGRLPAVVDDQGDHASALWALRFVCQVSSRIRTRDLYCVRAYFSLR
jgi:hypothetical protein